MTEAVVLLGEVEEDPLILALEPLLERLTRSLEDLNREFADVWVMPASIPGSFPEFEAVLGGVAPAYEIARSLAELFHPLPVRTAAARGQVRVAEAEGEPLEGPAVDRASDLLYRARKEDRLLLFDGGNPEIDTLANALTLVLYRNQQRWTERQTEIVRLYRKLHRQRAVAETLGVSQQSVSSSLAAAGWKMLADAESALATVLGASPPR